VGAVGFGFVTVPCGRLSASAMSQRAQTWTLQPKQKSAIEHAAEQK
jgi:hypothetical protein